MAKEKIVEKLPRDVRLGMSVGKMAELGKFDREFTVYGCAYQEDKKILYRISEDEETIQHFCEKSKKKGIYPTMLMSHGQITGVPSGMEDSIWQEEQRNLGYMLERSYRDVFLNLLNQLGNRSAMNGAYPVLQRWQDALEGRFRRDWQRIFDCFLEESFLTKQLSVEKYAELKRWSVSNWKQMEDDIVIKDIYERIMYGFLYEMNGTIQIKYDAQYAKIYRKRQALLCQGLLVTPIYNETFWMKTFSEFPQIKAKFEQQLKKLLEPCLSFMHQVAQLPPFIPVEEFAEIYATVKENGTPQEIDTLKLYGYQWNCLN